MMAQALSRRVCIKSSSWFFRPAMIILIIALMQANPAASLDPSPVVDGISAICPWGVGNIPGVPGPMEILSPSANTAPIVSADEDANPSFAIEGVASSSGTGRIVALGHDGFFINNALSINSNGIKNKQFGNNIINWLQNGHANKKILITTGHGELWVGGVDYKDFRDHLTSMGYEVVLYPGKITHDILSDVSILFISVPGPTLGDDEIGYIQSFVGSGGGLFLQGIGYSWHGPIENYPMNKLANPYGFRWIDGYISDSIHNYNGAPIFSFFYPSQGAILDVPYFQQSQSTDWCYLYTPSMVLQYYGHNVYPWDLAKEFETTAHQAFTVSGPWSFDFLKKYIESDRYKYGLRVHHSYLKNFWGLVDFTERVKKQIDLNIPPIFFYGNHAIVIVGYSVENENKYVYVHDPSGKLYPSSGLYDSDRMFIKVPWGKIVEDVFFSHAPVYFDIASDFDKKNNPMPPDASYWIDNSWISHYINEGTKSIPESNSILDKGIDFKNNPLQYITIPYPRGGINWFEDEYIDPKTKVKYTESNGNIRLKLAGMNPNKIPTYPNVVAIITKNDKIVKTVPIDMGGSMPSGSKGDNNIIDSSAGIPIEDIGDGPCTIFLLDCNNNHVIAQIDTRIISSKDSWTIAHSPVNLELTNPLGIRINKDSINNEGGMYYIQEDIDNDSNTDEMIIISKLIKGCYHIFVTPKNEAKLTDVYTLEFYSGGKTIILANDLPISSIPEKPSAIEVTNDGIIQPITVNTTAFTSSAAPGASINFTINITNTGTMPLNHIQVIDHLPDGLSYISDNRGGSVFGRNVTWNGLPSLDIGESIFINLVARIDPNASGNLINLAEATGIRAAEKQEEVSNSGYSTVIVLKPGIEVQKTLGLPEPVQYEQYCESRKVTGTGKIDVSTNMVDKKLALKYSNSMAGNGDVEIESENALSESAGKLQRSLGNNTTSLNLYEDSEMTYSGETPLSGGKYLESKEFYGGIGASIQEAFSVNEMEKDQQTFFASTDPTSNEVDQNKSDQLRNTSSTHLVALETKNTFNGTWGTDSNLHKPIYKDILAHQSFAGRFEIQKSIKFHENPVNEPPASSCEGLDC